MLARFTLTTNSADAWGCAQAQRCQTFFIHADRTVGHCKANPPRKHAHIASDQIAAAAPFGLVTLPVYHAIWNEPRDNFERLTFFPNIKRPAIMSNGSVSYQIAPPPAHLVGSLAHHTSLGSTALNDQEAMLLKLGLQYCEPLVRDSISD